MYLIGKNIYDTISNKKLTVTTVSIAKVAYLMTGKEAINTKRMHVI